MIIVAFIKGSAESFISMGRIVLRVFHRDGGAIEKVEPVLNARRRHDDGLIELTLQPLLDDLQVKQPKKPQRKPWPRAMEESF